MHEELKQRLLGLAMIAMPVLCSAAAAETIARPDLRDELLAMVAVDQAGRKAAEINGSTELGRIDRENLLRMKEIIAKDGWPTRSLVGEAASQAAWLLVQHADSDPEFQLKILARLKPLVTTHEVAPKEYAYLYDRTHDPQLYGTQGDCAGLAMWKPRPIDDPANVDRRRREVGLPPIKEYIGRMHQVCAPTGGG